MDPIRALMMFMSRIPPRLMILSVVGTATVVTLVVVGKYDQMQKDYDFKIRNTKPEQVIVVKEAPKVEAPAKLDFQSKLKAGYRAVTVNLDASAGLNAFIVPGSHVDVMALSGNGADAQAKPVLSDAEVVAVGAQIEKTETGVAAPANNVTFALTPQQAGKLLKATATGRIYLALRNDNDRTPVNTEAQVAQPIQIITKLPPPPPVIVVQQVPAKIVTPAAKPKFAVDQWAGNSHHEISFEKK